MKIVDLIDAELCLASLCEHAAKMREGIVIAQDGVPLAMLSPVIGPVRFAVDSVWEAVRQWEAAHPDYDDDFELPLRPCSS